MPDILLAIPCYNCEKQIPRVLEGLPSQAFQEFGKVMVIDNCSADQTVQRAIETARTLGLPRTEVVRNQSNLLLGGTHKVAFLEAQKMGFAYLAILHGDNQGEPQEILGHLKFLKAHPECDAILSSRFMQSSTRPGYSLLRSVGNRLFNWIYSVVTGYKILDVGGCMTIFKLSAFPNSEFLNFTDGFTFNNDILLYLIERHAAIHYLPITWKQSDQESNVNAARLGIKMLKTLWRWKLKGSPREPYRVRERYQFDSLFYSMRTLEESLHGY